LYRPKVNRPEVNNKVLVNLAYELVERKVSGICAEPIQYVLRGTDDKKSEEISNLNAMMDSEDKQDCDIEICRWRSICGTAYRFIGNDKADGMLLDESDFSLSAENPIYTFISYYTNNKPAFSCQIRKDNKGKKLYYCFTNAEYFVIQGGKIIKRGINGNGAIPVIEYPNNSRRISDIEITVTITDAINTLSSDRINGVEQFVSSWIKFVNCEIDKETFYEMRQEGALVVKSNNGTDNKADVDVMTTELNQSEGQVVFNDLFERFLSIQGLATRGNINTGGDTGNAVSLRNGHYESNLREAIDEPIIKKAERMTLRIILNRLRIKQGYTLLPSDIEIHINRDKLNNFFTKSETLKILLDCGIHYKRAIKTVGLFSDPEQVAVESSKRMELLYPEEINNTVETKVIE
jgi:SPP1 family phage portal protein